MTSPQRLSVKFFARPDPGTDIDLEPFIPLFHQFIQNASVEGLLIDVADYAHVPDGPGVMLIGHEVDYGFDLRDGRPGLLVTRKRCEGAGIPELVEDALRKALGAVVAIEANGSAGVRFGTDRVALYVTDQLRTPNDAAGFDALKGEVLPIAEKLFGAGAVEVARCHADDRRRALALELLAPSAADAETLLGRLGGPAPPVPKQTVEQGDWNISVEDLAGLRADGAAFVLIDVREPHEYETCNLGGRLIPLGTIPEGASDLEKDAHVIVHCKTGDRSAKATAALRKAGFSNVWNLRGGILAWSDRIDPSVPKY